MSDETMVWPALRPEDWQGLDRGRPVHCTGVDGDQFIGFAHHRDAEGEGVLIDGGSWTASIFEAENVRRLIAIANAALPDDDPRKITRARVEALRSVCRHNPDTLPGYGVPLRELADALASYLPPE